MNHHTPLQDNEHFAHVMIAAYAKQLSRADRDRLMLLAKGMAENSENFNEASFSSDVIFLRQICEAFGHQGSMDRMSAIHKLLGGSL